MEWWQTCRYLVLMCWCIRMLQILSIVKEKYSRGFKFKCICTKNNCVWWGVIIWKHHHLSQTSLIRIIYDNMTNKAQLQQNHENNKNCILWSVHWTVKFSTFRIGKCLLNWRLNKNAHDFILNAFNFISLCKLLTLMHTRHQYNMYFCCNESLLKSPKILNKELCVFAGICRTKIVTGIHEDPLQSEAMLITKCYNHYILELLAFVLFVLK